MRKLQSKLENIQNMLQASSECSEFLIMYYAFQSLLSTKSNIQWPVFD